MQSNQTNKPKEGYKVNRTRLFYVEGNSSLTPPSPSGGFMMDWSLYEVDETTSPPRLIVSWSGGIAAYLYGKDAYNFLKIVQDKAANKFKPERVN